MKYYRCMKCNKLHSVGFWKYLFATKFSNNVIMTKCGRCNEMSYHKLVDLKK